jgi:stage III sporulation protein AA
LGGEEILTYFPVELEAAIKKAGPDWEKAEEIRLRAGRPLLFSMDNREYALCREGRWMETDSPEFFHRQMDSFYQIQPMDIRKILDRLSEYSLYAYHEEVRQGYFTIEGGHRIGVAGKTVLEEGKRKTMKYLSFLNIRISHEKKGCAKKILPCLIEGENLYHTLILSPPGCGKTTLLRDAIRLLSDGFFYYDTGKQRKRWKGITVGVVDERNEIGASVRGVPVNDLGMRTDLLDGCPKEEGIFLLLRSMAPKIIAVDEIGGQGDFDAIRQAVLSGCSILATAHGNSVEELEDKPFFASFLKDKIFERYVVLSGNQRKGHVEGIYNREGKIACDGLDIS